MAAGRSRTAEGAPAMDTEPDAGKGDDGAPARDYAMFDAELTGAVMNVSLLRRLLRWLKPYRITFAVSGVLILIASTLQVMMPVLMSAVVIDHVLLEDDSGLTPDLGLLAVHDWLTASLNVSPLLGACLIYIALQIGTAVFGHAHRMTLITSVIKGLRDLRLDLFSHLETRPAAFYDRVAVGRVMTRVTNDIEALYELLRGIGTLIGEFVPFFVALGIMLAVDVELTLILLLVTPIMGTVTYYFRRTTRQLFRAVRMTLSALNQNLQENLAGLEVVQLSERQRFNLERYTSINVDNRTNELKSARPAEALPSSAPVAAPETDSAPALPVNKMLMRATLALEQVAGRNTALFSQPSHSTVPKFKLTGAQGRVQQDALNKAFNEDPAAVVREFEAAVASLAALDPSEQLTGHIIQETWRDNVPAKEHAQIVRTSEAVLDAYLALRQGNVARGMARLALLLAAMEQSVLDEGKWNLRAGTLLGMPPAPVHNYRTATAEQKPSGSNKLGPLAQFCSADRSTTALAVYRDNNPSTSQ